MLTFENVIDSFYLMARYFRDSRSSRVIAEAHLFGGALRREEALVPLAVDTSGSSFGPFKIYLGRGQKRRPSTPIETKMSNDDSSNSCVIF